MGEELFGKNILHYGTVHEIGNTYIEYIIIPQDELVGYMLVSPGFVQIKFNFFCDQPHSHINNKKSHFVQF